MLTCVRAAAQKLELDQARGRCFSLQVVGDDNTESRRCGRHVLMAPRLGRSD